MCQAFEVERQYMRAAEETIRRRGYDAHLSGIPRSDNPEPDHPNPQYSSKLQWWYGWDTAAAGIDFW